MYFQSFKPKLIQFQMTKVSHITRTKCKIFFSSVALTVALRANIVSDLSSYSLDFYSSSIIMQYLNFFFVNKIDNIFLLFEIIFKFLKA